jgi:prevent-host-death family protein
MTKVNMLEAKTNLSKLVEAVETGREPEIILARNGKPVARIVPIEQEPRQLGLAEGEFGELTDEILAEWNRENEKMWAEYLASPLFPESHAQPTKRRKRA